MNTQNNLNSDYRTTLEHHQLNDNGEQNVNLLNFISSSTELNEVEEDEPLLLRQRNSQRQISVNKIENNQLNSSDESEQHQERLSDTDILSDDDDDDEIPSEEDDDDDDDDDDDFDSKRRSRTKSKRGFGQAKSKRQVSLSENKIIFHKLSIWNILLVNLSDF